MGYMSVRRADFIALETDMHTNSSKFFFLQCIGTQEFIFINYGLKLVEEMHPIVTKRIIT